MSNRSIVPPIVLRPDQVPEDLMCSICMNVAIKPRITRCQHVFCESCIHSALDISNLCPIDREVCHRHQLNPLRGCLHRIWSNIQVKCGNGGCTWNGSIEDYERHLDQCEDNVQTELEGLKEEIAILRQRPDLPRLFDGEYNYRRENVVELSQLISRYLEDKPSDINENRIFNCVRACYNDLEKDYSDNPEHYYINMRMLLSTCLASTWFSDRQRDNFNTWYDKRF